jgi:hypothetical protein
VVSVVVTGCKCSGVHYTYNQWFTLTPLHLQSVTNTDTTTLTISDLHWHHYTYNQWFTLTPLHLQSVIYTDTTTLTISDLHWHYYTYNQWFTLTPLQCKLISTVTFQFNRGGNWYLTPLISTVTFQFYLGGNSWRKSDNRRNHKHIMSHWQSLLHHYTYNQWFTLTPLHLQSVIYTDTTTLTISDLHWHYYTYNQWFTLTPLHFSWEFDFRFWWDVRNVIKTVGDSWYVYGFCGYLISSTNYINIHCNISVLYWR